MITFFAAELTQSFPLRPHHQDGWRRQIKVIQGIFRFSCKPREPNLDLITGGVRLPRLIQIPSTALVAKRAFVQLDDLVCQEKLNLGIFSFVDVFPKLNHGVIGTRS